MIKCHKKKKRSNFYINIYLKLCDIRNTNLSIIENGERLLLFLAVEQILHWADFTSFFFNVVNPSMKKKAIPKRKSKRKERKLPIKEWEEKKKK